jgi:hypothetical protein
MLGEDHDGVNGPLRRWVWSSKVKVYPKGLLNGVPQGLIRDCTDRFQDSALINRADLMSQGE